MPRTLAIDWDRQQLRYLRADTARRGSKLRNVVAGEVALDSERDRDEQIRDALKELGAQGRVEVHVTLPAGAIETVTLRLPPASDAEVPVLVENLARQEFGIATDEPALDYIPAAAQEDGSREVTAMFLRDEEFSRVRSIVTSTGSVLSSLTLKPHGLRAWLSQKEGTAIAIAAGSRNCDVLIASNGTTVAARSVRLPDAASPELLAGHCLNEVKRTLITSAGSADPQPTELIVLGTGAVAEEIATSLTAEYSVNAQLLDPLENCDCELIPADSGSFAGLIGALQRADAAPVDFANPRRPPKPLSKSRVVAAAVAVLAVLLGGGGYYLWSQLDAIDTENARLESRLRELNELVRDSQKKRALASSLKAWESSRVSWLDELRDLTVRMPPRSDLTIRQLTASRGARGRSTITFSGIATQPDAVAKMEAALRDEYHTLRTPGLREQTRGDSRAWSFQTTIQLRPRQRDAYRESAP